MKSSTTNSDSLPSDIHTVYKKVVRANNPLTPSFRSASSAKLSTPPVTNIKSDLVPASDSSNLHRTCDRTSNSSLSSSSTEEIIIKQLPFHVRPVTTSGSSNGINIKPLKPAAVDYVAERPPTTAPDTTLRNQTAQRIPTKTAQLLWASAYSEQSIRYVTEQVALEQARQRKRLSSIQGHRIDRKYFVNGCGLSVDRSFDNRINSAFINRVNQRNLLSRTHLCKYSYQPKSRLSLMVNGRTRAGQNLELRSSTATLNNAEVKQNNAIKSSDQFTGKALECSVRENSDLTAVCSSEDVVGLADVGEIGGGNQRKTSDKAVRSVTFILPDEDTLAA